MKSSDERLKTYRFKDSWCIDIPFSWTGGLDEDKVYQFMIGAVKTGYYFQSIFMCLTVTNV